MLALQRPTTHEALSSDLTCDRMKNARTLVAGNWTRSAGRGIRGRGLCFPFLDSFPHSTDGNHHVRRRSKSPPTSEMAFSAVSTQEMSFRKLGSHQSHCPSLRLLISRHYVVLEELLLIDKCLPIAFCLQRSPLKSHHLNHQLSLIFIANHSYNIRPKN